MNIRQFGFTIMALCCIPAIATVQARCESDAVPSVAFLSAFSNVIIVGTATPENVTSTSLMVDIEVNRVIKGSIAVDSQIQIPVTNQSSACTVSATAGPVTAIWFLKALPDGTLTFANSPKSQSCHPFVYDYEMPDGAVPSEWAYPADADPKSKLAHELAWSIESHQGDGPVAAVMNADLLDGLEVKDALPLYQALYSSVVADVRSTGLIGLLRLGDPGALQALADNVDQIVNKPRRSTYLRAGQRLAITYASNNATEESVIAAAVGQIVNPNAATVEQLGRLSQASDSSILIRRAAARSLGEIHTPLAVTYLAPLLYEQNDPALRAHAIGGMACFANGVPLLDHTQSKGQLNLNYSSSYKTDATLAHFAKGLSTISQKEAYYLDFWRSWWSMNASAIETLASTATAGEKSEQNSSEHSHGSNFVSRM